MLTHKHNHILINHAHTQAQSHTHHATHAHAHHAYTLHGFLYVKVHICTYCGRQANLAKFCYDELNASNSHVWVQKTNILGPKKVLLSKSTPTLHDICTHQGFKT